jgi:hypothetical protein
MFYFSKFDYSYWAFLFLISFRAKLIIVNYAFVYENGRQKEAIFLVPSIPLGRWEGLKCKKRFDWTRSTLLEKVFNLWRFNRARYTSTKLLRPELTRGGRFATKDVNTRVDLALETKSTFCGLFLVKVHFFWIFVQVGYRTRDLQSKVQTILPNGRYCTIWCSMARLNICL